MKTHNGFNISVNYSSVGKSEKHENKWDKHKNLLSLSSSYIEIIIESNLNKYLMMYNNFRRTISWEIIRETR